MKFEWDRGNITKSLIKHGISNTEAESSFKDEYKLISDDVKHSVRENVIFVWAGLFLVVLLFLISQCAMERPG